ncbi:MAG: Tex family protein [Gemmataceae bacterium]
MNPSDPTPSPDNPDAPTPVAADTPPVAEPAPAAEAPAQEAAATPPAPALPSQQVPSVPPAPQPHDLSRIAQDLQIRKQQVEAVVGLLDEENTVPFITRYRKERTGGLNEDMIRRIQDRVHSLRSLADRKQTILKSIAYQGRLSDGLVEAVLAAETPKRLEDLYLPYKPKKKSKATEAREKGLGPVSEAIFFRDPAVNDLDAVVAGLVDPDKWLLNADDVMSGIRDILADIVADQADVRGPLRNFIWDVGQVAATKIETLPEGKGKEFEPYFAFKELVREIPPHRVLAINRGEKANVLRVHLDLNRDTAREIAAYHLNVADHPHRDLILTVMVDALDRLVLPSLEREVRRELTERAQDHAVLVFAKNLRSLLLQPPLRGKRVLAVDPGIRTGCKLAVLDETGKLLEDAVVYPHGQKKNQAEARRKLEQLVRKFQLSVVAIGNGTGCRETEQLVADLIADLENRRLNPTPTMSAPAAPEPTHAAAAVESHTAAPAPASAEAVIQTHTHTPTHTESSGTITSDPITLTSSLTLTTEVLAGPATVETTGTAVPDAATVTTAEVAPAAPKAPEIILDGLPEAPADLAYVIVIEAGASDYSASPVAREEFPNLDATTRGTISIGRRLQDPLAELVKIDPQHIGVGLYQHDVKPKHLKESLEGVISSCVNAVGVDLNTASVPLLRHVSGMNQLVARSVIEHRERHGAFTSREQLLQVAGLGDKRFTQAAGFLKLNDSPEPLDATWIHPESYPLARQILTELGLTPADLKDKAKLDELRGRLNGLNPADVAARYNAGEPTVRDIFDALARPGRDPREDLPPPIFKTGVLKLEDITPGMELKGTVLNVVPFGAFVDIGLKESGLVHISQMANRYIKSPYDVVAVGDVVNVWVIEVKPGEKKISLTMIAPGQERRMPPPGGGRGGFQGGPPRGDRPPQDQGERPPPPRGDRPPQPPRGDRPPQPPRGDRPGFQPRPQGQVGPRPGFQPRPQQPAREASVDTPKSTAPPPPPKKPLPPKPLPKLTTAKKSGKAPLNTFGELAAFFKPEEAPKPPEPPPAAEEPNPDAPPAS